MVFSSDKEESWTKISVFMFESSTAEVEANQRRLGLKRKPPSPCVFWGAWPVKQCLLFVMWEWSSYRYSMLDQWPLWVLLCTVLYFGEFCGTVCGTAVSILVLLQYVQPCSMLMFLSVLSLTSRRCCDSLHAEQKLPGERSVCSHGKGDPHVQN